MRNYAFCVRKPAAKMSKRHFADSFRIEKNAQRKIALRILCAKLTRNALLRSDPWTCAILGSERSYFSRWHAPNRTKPCDTISSHLDIPNILGTGRHAESRGAPSKTGTFDDGVNLTNSWAPWLGYRCSILFRILLLLCRFHKFAVSMRRRQATKKVQKIGDGTH